MVVPNEEKFIAFVWPHEMISPAISGIAGQTGAGIIFDISEIKPSQEFIDLIKAIEVPGLVDLKVSADHLLDPATFGLLESAGLSRVFVELWPVLVEDATALYLDKAEQLQESVQCVPVIGDLELLDQIIDNRPHLKTIAIKGNEASGFVGAQSALMLFNHLRSRLSEASNRPDIIIWGGVATPEAAAALLLVSATGLVFESLHWLTDLFSANDEIKKKISRLKADHTDLVGLNLDTPCRVFNKGNSRAVKELKDFSGALCGDEIRQEQRKFFASRIRAEAVAGHRADYGRDQLIPIGVEASFASSFVKRYGESTIGSISAFMDEIQARCEDGVKLSKPFEKSPAAKEFGTEYPIVQGAMSWISDSPEFALKVAQAGGLPTLALGLMDEPALKSQLGNIKEIMGEYPFAINVVALHENPFREAQFEWLKEIRPRFAVIAAGEPSQAKDLTGSGIETIYIAPNEELLKMAFDAGIKYVICEGNEAGGHVGEHSSLTLAQLILDMKRFEPELFKDKRIILAGGIYDRTTGFIASMLGAHAAQMGTAYLTTREIVETKALTNLYQRLILESESGGTVVTGEGVGLRVRSLKTPRMDSICSLERDFAAGSQDEAAFRQKMEALSAGSLQVAARGSWKSDSTTLTEQECLERGQFMSGECAGVLQKVVDLEELHREVSQAALKDVIPSAVRIRRSVKRREAEGESGISFASVPSSPGTSARNKVPDRERIAITGMSVVNSLGAGPENVWRASLNMESGITEIPPSKWNHDQYYDPKPRAEEKTYCKVAAFQSLEVDRKELGIPPQDFRTMTESTRISMWLAKQAIEESGILGSGINPERISVLISQNSGEAAGTLEDVIVRAISQNIVMSMGNVMQLNPDLNQRLVESVKKGRLAVDDTTLLGRLNCAAGGFICNKYGFQGPSFSVSAACATALVALWSAYQMIRNGTIDAAIVGGAEEILTPLHFLEFSAIGALAGISGKERPPHEMSRPFDSDRDGMVLGEGGGMLVIERESVARKRGATPLAYITSMGASNNHLGMVESSRVTQEIAIRSSFNGLHYGPEQVDMIECHATSTVQGDIEEVLALKNIFPSGHNLKLTSFKSQIGHTLGASGINSLIRGIMAMRDGVYPPTLNCDNPDPALGIDGTGFSISREPTEWNKGSSRPGRFQVNAFGFGGSNYVVQVEQERGGQDRAMPRKSGREAKEEKKTPKGVKMPDGVHMFRARLGAGSCRLGVVSQSEEEALELIKNAEPINNGGAIGVKRLRALARAGIHLGLEEAPTPAIAFVFPGQGSHYAGMGKELYDNFPIIREWMDRAAKVAEFDILKLLFQDREEDLQKTRWQQPALFTLEYAMVQLLISLGIEPRALAGHSLGELTALCLAGVYSFEDGFRIVNKRAICMDKACEMNIDPGVMMAVDAPLDYLEQRLEEQPEIYITNINSPNQVVLGGGAKVVEAFGEDLKQKGYRRTMLRVSMAFHSPIMKCIHDELDQFIQGIEFHAPKIPVISNTTKAPFPSDPTEIKKIVMAHLESPVHWMQNVRTLWEDHGVRLFVEVGPRDILSNLIGDSIKEAESIQTCLPSAEGLVLRTALAQLYAKGLLEPEKEPRMVQFPTIGESATETSEAPPPPAPSPRGEAGAVKYPVTTPSPAPVSGIDQIVQKTINSFVMESFGRFIKPALLDAIQKEYDPSYTEDKLDQVLASMWPSAPAIVSAPHATQPGQAPAAQPVPTPPTPAQEVAQEKEPDITEEIIAIIMEATGYDRDEIEPGMDLREDLSIRSSRLPVIMDAMEDRFKVKIDLEDFMGAQTIQDISDRLSALVGSDSSSGSSASTIGETDALQQEIQAEQEIEKASLKRLVFSDQPLEAMAPQPLELDSLESMAVLSAAGGTGIRKETASVFRRDYGALTIPLCFTGETSTSGENFVNLLDRNIEAMIRERQEEIKSWSGMALIIDERLEDRLETMDDVSAALKGFFCLLKTFMESKSKKFAIVMRRGSAAAVHGRILWQSITAMFLCAAQEYSSVQFRSVQIDDHTDLRLAIRAALDRNRKPVEHLWKRGELATGAFGPSVTEYKEKEAISLNPDDLILVTGGGHGIASSLAKAIGGLGCKLALLGRTSLENAQDYSALLSAGPLEKEDLEVAVINARPGLHGEDLEKAISELASKLEIMENLETLRQAGIEARYFSCDVTDAKALADTVQQIHESLGPVTGIAHAAGVLRDAYIGQMTSRDFETAANVKLMGAWNLVEAVDPMRLKLFISLSSAAAAQGNPGQVNYAAGNRGMSELTKVMKERYPEILCKALFLPPIEGAGMAEDPEVRAWMKRMNAAYVHVDELGELFMREVILADEEDVWVMFLRRLPDLATVRLDQSDPEPGPDEIRMETVQFKSSNFPMVDEITRTDFTEGALRAIRSFSQDKDPWVLDHLPFKSLKSPLLSAIMALEYFMETCKIMFPYLKVVGVRDAMFLDIVECPKGVERVSEVNCRTIGQSSGQTRCKVSLETRDVSPSGRLMDRKSINYEALIILAGHFTPLSADMPGFPVQEKEFTTPPMDRDRVMAWYDERTRMQGRYRLMDRVFGSGNGGVKGEFTYRVSDDFSAPLKTDYQYSPYLLEALMQLVVFYIIMEDETETRTMIPYRIGELVLGRKCEHGEKITLEARLKKSDSEGLIWDARGLDKEGEVLMIAKDIQLRWLSIR